MYTPHPEINTPDSNTIIWRYMDLWKFLDLIDNKKLFLSRADTYEDKFECRIPNYSVNDLSESHTLKRIDSFLELTLKKSHYISSWTEDTSETYPMWKIYSDYRNSIAIKSTIGNLIDSLKDESLNNYIGKINYLNPEKKSYNFRGNIFQFFYEKRDYFKFENEIRILTELKYKNTTELLKLPIGIKICIDPEKLIKEIYLAPLADKNIKNLIELKLEQLKLNIPIYFSKI